MTTTQAFDQIGSVTATRIHEWIGELFPRPVLLPDSDRADWEVERSWLVPEFWSPDSENAWMRSGHQHPSAPRSHRLEHSVHRWRLAAHLSQRHVLDATS